MTDSAPQRFAFAVDSEMWRINHQKCGLFFGPAAAILQVAHPRIGQGVADHSSFESDSIGRLTRTLQSTNRIAFGTVEEAEAIRERLRQVHRGVTGKTSEGIEGNPRYSAFEPELLLWVLATLVMAAQQGYEMVYGPLPPDRREQFYREMRQFGTYFGLDENYGPTDSIEFEHYYHAMIHGDLLGSHPLCARMARAIAEPRDSYAARKVGQAIRFLPIETLPSPVRERIGFRSTPFTRTSMGILRRSAPVAFPCLPRRMRWFPESFQRIKREREDSRDTDSTSQR